MKENEPSIVPVENFPPGKPTTTKRVLRQQRRSYCASRLLAGLLSATVFLVVLAMSGAFVLFEQEHIMGGGILCATATVFLWLAYWAAKYQGVLEQNPLSQLAGTVVGRAQLKSKE